MSRYTFQNKNGECCAYGFDTQTGEYFADVFDDNKEIMIDEISSYGRLTYNGKSGSNSDIYEFIMKQLDKQYCKTYAEHVDRLKTKLLMDLPF